VDLVVEGGRNAADPVEGSPRRVVACMHGSSSRGNGLDGPVDGLGGLVHGFFFFVFSFRFTQASNVTACINCDTFLSRWTVCLPRKPFLTASGKIFVVVSAHQENTLLLPAIQTLPVGIS
jgi:hypothetical protein